MRKLFLIGLLACAFAGNPNSADAKAPNLLSYQGSIKATNGSVVNKTMTVTYKIYNQENGGTAVWNETDAVEVKNGLFNTYLGTKTELNTELFKEELWLEVVLDNGDVMPRTRLAANPYSFQAGIAATADTANIAKDVVDSVMTWVKFTPAALKAGGILNGTYPNPSLNMDAIPQYGIPGDKIAKGVYTHFSTSPAGPALGDAEGSTFPYIYIANNKIANRHLQNGAVSVDKIASTGVTAGKVLVADGNNGTKWANESDPSVQTTANYIPTTNANGDLVNGSIQDNAGAVTIGNSISLNASTGAVAAKSMVVSGTLTAGAITLKTTAVASMVQFTTAFANGTAIFNVTDGTDLYDIPTAIGGVAVEQGRVVYVYSDAPSATVNSNPIMQGQIAMFVFVAGNWVKL